MPEKVAIFLINSKIAINVYFMENCVFKRNLREFKGFRGARKSEEAKGHARVKKIALKIASTSQGQQNIYRNFHCHCIIVVFQN